MININAHYSPLRGIAITGLILLLLLVQTLPLFVRDSFILTTAALLLLVSLTNFKIAWVAFVLYLPLVFLMVGMFGDAKINGVRMFLIIFLGIFVISPKPKKFWTMLCKNQAFIGLGLFFLANVVSAVVSRQSEALFRSLIYLEPLGLFLLSYFFVRRRPANWRTLMWAIGISGVYVILLGLLELVTQKPLIEVLGIKNTIYEVEKLQFYLSENRFGLGGRISSTLLQPVYAGLFFGEILICQTYYIGAYKKLHRSLLYLNIPLCLMMVLLTGSRGPILALVAALLAFIAFIRKKRNAFVIVVLGLGILMFVIANLIPGIRSFMLASFDPFDKTSANLFVRINLSNSLLNFFIANPIFGYGPGLIQKLAVQGVYGFEGLTGMENQYATILADGGLLSGVSYLAFIYGVFSIAMKAYRNKALELRNAGVMMLALAAYFFTVVISVNATTAMGGYIFVIVAGGLAGICDAQSQVFKSNPSPSSPILMEKSSSILLR